MKKQLTENTLLTNQHIFLYEEQANDEVTYLKNHFCGQVYSVNNFIPNKNYKNTMIYLCGDIKRILEKFDLSTTISNIIKELSTNYDGVESNVITLGEVPINMHNVGVYFREFFNSDKDYYQSIVDEHEFQALTQSNKPGTAFRKGIYLTKVKEESGEIKFKLLRCSTNLDGPTDNFRETDNEIVDKVNRVSQFFFKDTIKLNHVLAQTYHNSEVDGKQKKAKIAEHSDKTKDMPKNALMAFCTFYKDFKEIKGVSKCGYDYCYGKNNSILTVLRFRLKNEVTDKSLTKQFDITLYPNSVFLMSLHTNRLYTHEIIPSTLSVDKICTRLGYVVRCSNTDAVFKDNQTYIRKHGHDFKLEEPTKEGIKELQELYYKENTTIETVDYEDKFYFSMNNGDYMKPIV